LAIPWKKRRMWTEEEFDCNFIRAHVNIKDSIYEPMEIEAIIPVYPYQATSFYSESTFPPL